MTCAVPSRGALRHPPASARASDAAGRELFWVWWGFVLLGSGLGGVGFSGGMGCCLVLGWWCVVVVLVRPVLVGPVGPGQGGVLGFVGVIPAGGVGVVDALGLGEAVGRLRGGVVVAVGRGPGRGPGVDLLGPFGESYGGGPRAGIGVRDRPDGPVSAAGAAGRLRGVGNRVGLHVRRDPPRGDPSAGGVDDGARVGRSRPGRSAGGIGHPRSVGPVRGEPVIRQIRGPWRCRGPAWS